MPGNRTWQRKSTFPSFMFLPSLLPNRIQRRQLVLLSTRASKLPSLLLTLCFRSVASLLNDGSSPCCVIVVVRKPISPHPDRSSLRSVLRLPELAATNWARGSGVRFCQPALQVARFAAQPPTDLGMSLSDALGSEADAASMARGLQASPIQAPGVGRGTGGAFTAAPSFRGPRTGSAGESTSADSAAGLQSLASTGGGGGGGGGGSQSGATTATTQSRAAGSATKKGVTLPSVANDFTSLEIERRKLITELSTLQQTRATLEERHSKSLEGRNSQLAALGKYDRFFLNDKGHHPLGRRNAVLATKFIVERQLNKVEVELGRVIAKRNAASDNNADVRRRIDSVRRESVVFRDLFNKMEVRRPPRSGDAHDVQVYTRSRHDERMQCVCSVTAGGVSWLLLRQPCSGWGVDR